MPLIFLSGGFLNPAITLALWLAGKLSYLKAASFIIVQTIASFVAAGLILAIFGDKAKEYFLGIPTLGLGIDLANGVIIEAVLTAFLIFIVFATVVDRRGPVSFAPLSLGFFLTAATILAMPLSGAIFNPARAIGPAVFSGFYEMLAVWLIGPLAGSLFGIVYEVTFLRRGKK